jgi:hypothetical protein
VTASALIFFSPALILPAGPLALVQVLQPSSSKTSRFQLAFCSREALCGQVCWLPKFPPGCWLASSPVSRPDSKCPVNFCFSGGQLFQFLRFSARCSALWTVQSLRHKHAERLAWEGFSPQWSLTGAKKFSIFPSNSSVCCCGLNLGGALEPPDQKSQGFVV